MGPERRDHPFPQKKVVVSPARQGGTRFPGRPKAKSKKGGSNRTLPESTDSSKKGEIK